MNSTHQALLAIAASAGVAVGTVQAQDAGAPEAPETRVAEPAAVEQAVSEQTESEQPMPSIVERDEEGMLIVPDELPELEAVALLELDQPTRDRLRVMVREREELIDTLLIHNSFAVFALRQNAPDFFNHRAKKTTLSVNTKAARETMRIKGERLFARGALIREIREIIPEDQHESFNAMLDEYYLAIADERSRANGWTGPDADPEQAEEELDARTIKLRERAHRSQMKQLIREINRRYARPIGSSPEEVDAYLTRLELEPESEMQIVAIAYQHLDERDADPRRAKDDPILIGDVVKDLDWPANRSLLNRAREVERSGDEQAADSNS